MVVDVIVVFMHCVGVGVDKGGWIEGFCPVLVAYVQAKAVVSCPSESVVARCRRIEVAFPNFSIVGAKYLHRLELSSHSFL